MTWRKIFANNHHYISHLIFLLPLSSLFFLPLSPSPSLSLSFCSLCVFSPLSFSSCTASRFFGFQQQTNKKRKKELKYKRPDWPNDEKWRICRFETENEWGLIIIESYLCVCVWTVAAVSHQFDTRNMHISILRRFVCLFIGDGSVCSHVANKKYLENSSCELSLLLLLPVPFEWICASKRSSFSFMNWHRPDDLHPFVPYINLTNKQRKDVN